MKMLFRFITLPAFCAWTVSAQVVNIDFNLGATETHSALAAAPDSPSNTLWNGVTALGISVPGTANGSTTASGLLSSDGSPSGWDLTVTYTGQGDLPDPGHEAVPLLRDYVQVNAGTSSVPLTASITLSGLAPGTHIHGPAVVEEAEATSVIPPGTSAHVDEHGNLVIETGGEG